MYKIAGLLEKLEACGFTVDRWKISREVYQGFLDIVRELGFPEGMFREFLDENLCERFDKNESKIYEFDFNEMTKKENEYYIYYDVINGFVHEGLMIRNEIDGESASFIKYLYHNGHFYQNGCFMLNTIIVDLCGCCETHYKWMDSTLSVNKETISELVCYEDDFEGEFPTIGLDCFYIPIYKDIMKDRHEDIVLEKK